MQAPKTILDHNGQPFNRKPTPQQLVSEQMSGYRPPTHAISTNWQFDDMPPFGMWVVERMRIDPQVRLATLIHQAPLMKPKWEITAKDPRVAKFVADTLKTVWRRAAYKMARALPYTVSGGEIIYRKKSDGLLHFRNMQIM